MNYKELKFQDKYIGKKLISGARSFVLSNDMHEKDKKYIYNLITKQVFDIFSKQSVDINMSAPVTKEEIKVIEVKNVSKDDIKLESKTLKELRIMFPTIKARSKEDFLKELKQIKR